MKSMLHEASSVEKAIQKAWQESGKPEEFTVKILEAGERGFLWFGGRPAIVSISFDPKRTSKGNTRSGQSGRNSAGNRQQQRPIQDTLLSGKPAAPAARQATPSNSSRTSAIGRPQQQDHRNGQRQQPQQQSAQRDHARTGQQNEELQGWTVEHAQDVLASLQEICSISNIAYELEHRIEGRNLTIMFNKSFFSSKEDERQFFISLSYLLVQILKKKHKKKFKGFHLILNAKQSRNDGNTRTDTPAE